MRIEQKHAKLRSYFHCLCQNVRDPGRFADAGGAEHGEMLVQHFINIDAGVDRGVLLQAADADHVRAGFVENDPKLTIGQRMRCVADGWIACDAAAEDESGAGRHDLAHEVHTCDRAVICGER